MISPFIAAFTGTAVEFFETAVIAYAIVRAGYPREALAAVVIGHVLVAVLAITLLPLNQMLPVFWLRVLAAFLLTAMGLHWTQKSIRRLIANKRPRWAEDPLGKLKVSPTVEAAVQAFSPFVFLVMAKSSVVEAAEIVVVVLPIGAATAAWNQVLWGSPGVSRFIRITRASSKVSLTFAASRSRSLMRHCPGFVVSWVPHARGRFRSATFSTHCKETPAIRPSISLNHSYLFPSISGYFLENGIWL